MNISEGSPFSSTVLLACILSVSGVLQAQTPGSSPSQTEGSYIAAYRTPTHVGRSKPAVFHGVVDEVIEFLKSNRVALVSDSSRKMIRTANAISVDSLLNVTRDVGASHLLFLSVGRPATQRVKIHLQCFDLSGNLLWEEIVKGGSLSGKKAVRNALAKLKERLTGRLGQAGLPMLQETPPRSTVALTAQNPTEQQSPPPSPAADSEVQQQPPKLLLREGAEVNLQFAQKLTAKSAVVGELIELVLIEDLRVGDFVVAKKGARALGTVVAGKKSEKRKRARELKVRLDFIKVGHARIKIRGEKEAKGKRNKKAMVAGTAALGLVGLLATSKKKFVIPEGTPVKGYVDEDIELPVIAD